MGIILGRTLGTCTVANSSSPLPFASLIFFSSRLLKIIRDDLEIEGDDIFHIEGPLDLTFLMKMYGLEGFGHLKESGYLANPPLRLLLWSNPHSS